MSDRYDFVVIGGGSAGYAAASTASRLGLRTAVVEGAEHIGGLCILRGCMPSKTLLESAHRAESVRRAGEFGLRAEYLGPDGPKIVARKRLLVSDFATYRRQQLESGKFELIRGRAAFLDAQTLEVTRAEGEPLRLESRAFLVATGSRISRVHVPGLDDAGCWDSDETLDAASIPKSVIVLGGGAIGLEFASYYAGLGVEVSVIQRNVQLLKEMDRDIADELARALEAHGMRIFRDTAIASTERSGSHKRVHFYQGGEKKTVEAEQIIYALGREALTDGLQLDQAGVALERSREVRVTATQQSSSAHIFAAGDVCGPLQVVHIAIQQGELAARNAARLLQGDTEPLEQMDYALKLFAVFTQPEVAAIGLTEREAQEQGRDVLTATYPFNDHGKSMVRGETDGFVKLIVERESRRIVGAAAIGPEVSELIHEIAAVMHFRGTAGDLARIPHYHPTLSEIWTYPAEELA